MKRDKLVVFWSKRERDFVIRYPRRCDGHLAYGHFCAERLRRAPGETPPWDFDPSFVNELEKRGYDTTTLRFSVNLRSPESEKEPRS